MLAAAAKAAGGADDRSSLSVLLSPREGALTRRWRQQHFLDLAKVVASLGVFKLILPKQKKRKKAHPVCCSKSAHVVRVGRRKEGWRGARA